MKYQREAILLSTLFSTTLFKSNKKQTQSKEKRSSDKIPFFFSNCYDMTILMIVYSFYKNKKRDLKHYHHFPRLNPRPSTMLNTHQEGHQSRAYTIKKI
jgi:hypothetical protein